MILSAPFRTLKPTALLFVAMLLTASVGVAQDADGGELGASTYASACLACHQATGLGLPGVFPPLAGHAPALLGYEGSREYIAKLSLYGLQGEIVVLDATYNQVMVGHESLLDDEQLAAVVNYVMHVFGNADLLPEDHAPFTPEEFAAYRGLGLTGADVHALREELGIGVAVE